MGTGSQASYKNCPMCKEEIHSDAVVCKHCGYDYRTESITGAVAAPATVTKNNGLAIASMVLGIVWVYWVGSFLAIIFGHVSLRQIRQSTGTQGGRGMAIAGLVLGYIGLATLVFVVALVVLTVDASDVRFDEISDRLTDLTTVP